MKPDEIRKLKLKKSKKSEKSKSTNSTANPNSLDIYFHSTTSKKQQTDSLKQETDNDSPKQEIDNDSLEALKLKHTKRSSNI